MGEGEWSDAPKLPDPGKGTKRHPVGAISADIPPDRHTIMAGCLAGILQVISEMPSGECLIGYVGTHASQLSQPSSTPIEASEDMEHG